MFYLKIVIYYKIPPSLLLFKCVIAHNCVSVGSQVSVVLNFITSNSALSHLAWPRMSWPGTDDASGAVKALKRKNVLRISADRRNGLNCDFDGR